MSRPVSAALSFASRSSREACRRAAISACAASSSSTSRSPPRAPLSAPVVLEILLASRGCCVEPGLPFLALVAPHLLRRVGLCLHADFVVVPVTASLLIDELDDRLLRSRDAIAVAIAVSTALREPRSIFGATLAAHHAWVSSDQSSRDG